MTRLLLPLLLLAGSLGLYVLNVPYWLTFGIFTGAVAIVPFFGTLVSTTLPALFVLGGSGIWGFGPGGHATLVRAPAALRASVAPFGAEADALAALTRRVKESFDPQGVLGPGRMWAGV